MDTKQTTNVKKYLAIALTFASYFAVVFGAPAVVGAIVRYPVSASLGTGDITSTMILDNTITGSDISRSASTTMFRLQVSDLSATSTTATSTFIGAIGIGTGSPNSKLTIVPTNSTTNGTKYVDIVTSTGVSAFTVQSAGSGNGADSIVGGTTGSYIFKVAGGAGTNIVLDAGLGGTDNNTYVNFIRNGASRWSIGKKSTNDFVVLDTNSSTQPFTVQYTTGNVGIGTSSPYAALSVVGAGGVVAGTFTATSTTATSTFSGGVKLNLSGSGVEFSDGSLMTTAAVDWVQIGEAVATSTESGMSITIGAYQQLRIAVYASTTASAILGLMFNNDTAANYVHKINSVDGINDSSGGGSMIQLDAGATTSARFINLDVANTASAYKFVRGTGIIKPQVPDNTIDLVQYGGMWRSNAQATTISLICSGGSSCINNTSVRLTIWAKRN